MKEKEVIDLSSDNEAAVHGEDDNTYTLHEFQNDRVFGWEVIVTAPRASNAKPRVLV
ncbi:hypothetical protein A2U01_0119407, partial [Trifolium medium]|nr:hypothetical protein [Trifolium medium]